MLLLVILLMVMAISSWAATLLVRRYAISRSLIDVPNHRSSHVSPTPRGGGLAIAGVVLGGIVLQMAIGWIDVSIVIGLVGGGGIVALVGWWDDHRSIPVRRRIVAQIIAGGWAIYWIGPIDVLLLGNWSFPLGPAGPVLCIVGLVWLTNLFNFMDGIDGLAASEAVAVAGVGGVLLVYSGSKELGASAWILAAATAGFLVWNWPPARIFLGDVGSGFLGFMLGALAVAGARQGALPLVVWVLLLGVFVFDATSTLLRRLPKEKFYEAHCRHAYQRAVQAGWSHRRVTATVLLVNALLSVLAAIAWRVPSTTLVALASAIGLLSLCYYYVERRRPMWADVPSATSGRPSQPMNSTDARDER